MSTPVATGATTISAGGWLTSAPLAPVATTIAEGEAASGTTLPVSTIWAWPKSVVAWTGATAKL